MKRANHYMNLPYTVVLRQDADSDVVAKIVELPGLSTYRKSPREALENLEEVKRAWFEDAISCGDVIPEPEAEEPLPSGKWVQRVPRSLHRKLVEMARREKVSLNQLVTSILAEAAGHLGARQRQHARRVANRQPAA